MARVADPPGASDAMGPALIPITAIDRDRHRNSWHLTNKVIGENTLAVTWAGTKPRERFRYGLLPTCKTPLVGDRGGIQHRVACFRTVGVFALIRYRGTPHSHVESSLLNVLVQALRRKDAAIHGPPDAGPQNLRRDNRAAQVELAVRGVEREGAHPPGKDHGLP